MKNQQNFCFLIKVKQKESKSTSNKDAEATQKQIEQLKGQLQKYKEDVEQVELFGMQREDYEQKKELCKNIVLQSRELEAQIKDADITEKN